MAKPPDILLLGDSHHVHVWTRMLTGTSLRLWQGPDSMDAEAVFDVIVTDQEVTEDMLPGPAACLRRSRGEIGTIRVGEKGTADVRLPTDVTPRELQLACLLLTEVVRLRRQCRRERQSRRLMSQLALRDALTGLPNRRAWEDRLVAWNPQTANQAVGDLPHPTTRRISGLAVIDLDHFKAINEHYGHVIGDRVLQEVSDRLADCVSPEVFVARLGGDEFALLVTGDDAATVAAQVEQLRAACCSQISPRLTASCGIAFRQTGRDVDAAQVFQAADRALRQAKSMGRNRSVMADAASAATPEQNPAHP
jgi:diguanylate cyclase (GGDEF)-like protein